MLGAGLAIFAVAFVAPLLAFYSGFGLGTLLLPAMIVVLPPEVAVAATAVVHFANNILKVVLMWREAKLTIALRFGLPAVVTAFLGAWVLTQLAAAGWEFTYHLGQTQVSVEAAKGVLAVMIFAFAFFELVPKLRAIRFDAKYLPLGGLLSGFFGGLSGHQGALRSAFLIKVGLAPKSFVATNAVTGFLVDAARITIYASVLIPAFKGSGELDTSWPLVMAAMAGAFAGVILGRKHIERATISGLQTLVGAVLLLIALGLGLGVI